MASTSSKVFIAALILFVLVAGGLYYLASNLNGIVAGVIEKQGSTATQTAVAVDGVDIRIADAAASLSGLSVANPEGFAGNAVELGAFSVRLDPGSLATDTIVINAITVSGARINVLQQGTRNNLRELLGNLQQLRSGAAAPAEDSGGKRIIIDRFTLEGASASVAVADLDEMREVELPPIVVRDIGRASNGATAAQVAQQLLQPVLEAAISSAATQVIKDRAKEKINEAVGGFLKDLTKKK